MRTIEIVHGMRFVLCLRPIYMEIQNLRGQQKITPPLLIISRIYTHTHRRAVEWRGFKIEMRVIDCQVSKIKHIIRDFFLS